MTTEVIPLFASEAEVDAAWRRYRDLASRIPGEPGLLADRDFMERLIRAEMEWKRLFMKQEAAR